MVSTLIRFGKGFIDWLTPGIYSNFLKLKCSRFESIFYLKKSNIDELRFIEICLVIEKNCGKLDYEDIQYKVRLKVHHLSKYLQLLIQK